MANDNDPITYRKVVQDIREFIDRNPNTVIPRLRKSLQRIVELRETYFKFIDKNKIEIRKKEWDEESKKEVEVVSYDYPQSLKDNIANWPVDPFMLFPDHTPRDKITVMLYGKSIIGRDLTDEEKSLVDDGILAAVYDDSRAENEPKINKGVLTGEAEDEYERIQEKLYGESAARYLKGALERVSVKVKADLAGEQKKAGTNAGQEVPKKPRILLKEANLQLRAIYEGEADNIEKTQRLPKMSDVAKEIGCSVGLLYKCPFMVTIEEMRKRFKKGRKPKERKLKDEILIARPDDKTVDPSDEAAQREEIERLETEQKADEAEEIKQSAAAKKKYEEKRQGNIDAGY